MGAAARGLARAVADHNEGELLAKARQDRTRARVERVHGPLMLQAQRDQLVQEDGIVTKPQLQHHHSQGRSGIARPAEE